MAQQIGYSKKVMEHFMNPRNVGLIENADATARWAIQFAEISWRSSSKLKTT
jgi:NifU-like protein involved in Fe-S cluster formation